jgi:hypothetical protein
LHPAEDVCEVQAGFAQEVPGADVRGQVDDLALFVQVGVPVSAGDGFDVPFDQVLQGGQGRVDGFNVYGWDRRAGTIRAVQVVLMVVFLCLG